MLWAGYELRLWDSLPTPAIALIRSWFALLPIHQFQVSHPLARNHPQHRFLFDPLSQPLSRFRALIPVLVPALTPALCLAPPNRLILVQNH